MTDIPTPPAPPVLGANAKGLFARMLSFDTLIGSGLVKLMYFLGLIAIGFATLIGLLGALGGMTQNAFVGLGMLVGVGIAAVVGVVTWRFSCELAILAFLAYDRLGQIRDRLPSG